VYVPLPHGNGEQRLNAAPIEQAGGGGAARDGWRARAWPPPGLKLPARKSQHARASTQEPAVKSQQ